MRSCLRWLILLLAVLVPWTAAAQNDPVRPPDFLTVDEDVVAITNLPNGRGSASITVSDYCTCTLVIEGKSHPEADWELIEGAPTIDGDGVYSVSAAGLWGLRVRADAFTSGSTKISMRVSSAGGGGGGAALGEVMVDIVGFATEAKQDTIIGHIDALGTTLLGHVAELNDALLNFDNDGGTQNRVTFGVGIPSASGMVVAGTTTNPFVTSLTGDAASDLNDIRGFTSTTADKLTSIDSRLIAAADYNQAAKTQGDQVMFYASDTAPTATTAGFAQRPWVDLNGRIQTNLSQIGGVTTPTITTQADNQSFSLDSLIVSAFTYCSDGSNFDLCLATTRGSGAVDSATTRVSISTDDDVSDAATLFEATLTPAHDDADAGNGFKLAGRAVSFGATPTAVAAADRTNLYATRAGVPFTQPGHPNMQSVECQVEDADGAQTGTACVSVSAGTLIVVTGVAVHCDASNSGPINVIVALDTDGTFPSRAHNAGAAFVAAFDGVPAGGGMSKGFAGGVLAVGADDADLRYTTEDPVGGACSIEASYYTIAG